MPDTNYLNEEESTFVLPTLSTIDTSVSHEDFDILQIIIELSKCND